MARNELPEQYLRDMEELLQEEYPAFLTSLSERPLSGLRVNTLKADPEKIAGLLGLTDRVPWTRNGFYLPEEKGLTRHPFYFAGLYYIQEPSAMISAALLGTKPGERVLDLCAAPGGKSTQIGADLKGSGVLVSNDLSSSRAKALLKNIELMGIGNAVLTCEDSGRLSEAYPSWFDRILVDAPCSGEGMFRKHPAVIRAYLEHGRDFYCEVQAKLLDDAAAMLAPGGPLLYSTCTYNRREDEDQIEAFLKRHPEFSPDPAAPLPGVVPSGTIKGLSGSISPETLSACIRLLPHRAKAEGHFAARLKKEGEARKLPGTRTDFGMTSGGKMQGRSGRWSSQGTSKLPEAVSAFLGTIRRDFDPERIRLQGEYVTYLPEGGCCPEGLRYLRTGLLLGQLKNGRFKPSQALAMNLRAEEWENPVTLSLEDPAVIRYLKGETVDCPQNSGSGLRLLTVEGWPLGFVKQERDRLKNMYLPGWRMQ